MRKTPPRNCELLAFKYFMTYSIILKKDCFRKKIPKVAILLDLSFYFVETVFYINVNSLHSDLSLTITSSADPYVNSQVRSVPLYMFSQRLVLCLPDIFSVCNSRWEHLFCRQSFRTAELASPAVLSSPIAVLTTEQDLAAVSLEWNDSTQLCLLMLSLQKISKWV